MSNSIAGGDFSTPKEFYRAYESLPPEIRRWLQSAVLDWSTTQIAKTYDILGLAPAKFIRDVLESSCREWVAMETFALYGPDHPGVTRRYLERELRAHGLSDNPNRVHRNGLA